MKFLAEYIDGQLIVSDPARWDGFLRSIGGVIQIDAQRYRGTRTDQQNKYLHAVVFRMIADEIGDDEEEVKDYFKRKFLSKKKYIGGQEENIVRDTSDLSPTEFIDFVEEIRMFASKFLSLNIPDPHVADKNNLL